VSSRKTDKALVRAESNLEEYPLFAVKTRNRKEDQLVFERRREGGSETELVQRWEVEPPAKLGMPGPFDQDVYLAVLQLLERRGGMPRTGELDFSLYELRKILSWSVSGNSYEKIRQSLRRVASTTLTSENAFYSKAEERFLSDTFQIWSVHFRRTRQGRNTRERHTLRFHPIFIRNYMAQYLKGLDPTFYWSLTSPLSKRLYRLIDHQRDGRLVWQTDLYALRQQVPLSNYSYPSEIKRVLRVAHEELREQGFLSAVDDEGKIAISYRISLEFARRQRARELSGDPGELFAIERLVSEGLRGDVARDLVASYGAKRCLRCADALVAKPKKLPSAPLSQAPNQEEPLEDEPALDPRAIKAWDSLVKDLVVLRGRDSLPPWFDQFTGAQLEGTALTVLVPNSTAANHLNKHFGEDLVRLWLERAGTDAILQVTTALGSSKRAALTG